MADDTISPRPDPRTADTGDQGGYATAGAGTSYVERPPERERPARGPYAGRGPRNYRRSDSTIYEDVCEGLKASPDLDAGDIEVEVDGGEVTLNGTVESRDARWLAEDLAESVPGVRAVHNRLRVAHG
jgi:osmotically-inducible protein OsmY